MLPSSCQSSLQLIGRQRLQRADSGSQQYRKGNQTAAAGNAVQRAGKQAGQKKQAQQFE